MANFILLTRFTEQGISKAKDTVQRAESAMQMAGRMGVNIKDIYWTLGEWPGSHRPLLPHWAILIPSVIGLLLRRARQLVVWYPKS